MDFTGIASITCTATDMAEAKRLFTNWGLAKVSATRTRLVFETSAGNRIEVRADGTVHSVDDLGIHIGFRVWKPRRPAARPATRWNRPAERVRVDREATAYRDGAHPSKIGHIVTW